MGEGIKSKFALQEVPPQTEKTAELSNHEKKLSSPERAGPFDVAVEQLKTNERALKLLVLAEQGYSPSSEELKNLDVRQTLGGVRRRYPTVEDIAYDLSQTVREQVGVERQSNWTDQQYENTIKMKQKEYVQSAIEFRKSLEPMYDKFGAAVSAEIKERVIDNLRDVIRTVELGTTGKERYFEKNLLAAAKQDLTPEEAQVILQIAEGYQNIYRRQFPDKPLSLEIDGTSRQIKERSGLALQEAKHKLNAVYERQEQKKPEAVESRVEKQETIISFMDFVRGHEAEIDRRVAQGEDLWALIYREFYNANENKKYKEGSPELEKMKDIYASEFSRVYEELYKKSINGNKELSIKQNTAGDASWLQYTVNKGVDEIKDDGNLGRFYLNLKPEYTPRFFMQAVETFSKAGVDIISKIPNSFKSATAWQARMGSPVYEVDEMSEDAFNRNDKMVIYFKNDQEKEVLQIVEQLARQNQEVFENTGIPKFTAKIAEGIGFGQHPPLELIKKKPHGVDNISFGTLRSLALASVYQEAKDSGLSPSDQRFNFEESFRRACGRYQIDPANPTFNRSRGPEKFSHIRNRVGKI